MNQTQQPLIFISTTYNSRSQLDFLFKNSTQVLKYLEGEEIQNPIFLSLVTASQKTTLAQNKFPIQIIDENTDLSRYKFFFTYEANQSDKLASLGAVIPLSSHHTLLRLTPHTEYAQPVGLPVQFFESPLFGPVPSPKYQTATITTAPSPASLPPSSSHKKSFSPFFIVIGLAILIIMGIVLKKKGWEIKQILLIEMIIAGLLIIVKLLF